MGTVLNPVFLDGTLWNKQVELPLEQKIKLATQIIIGKLKNQLNLIKYYHKYHKDILGGKLSEKYVEVEIYFYYYFLNRILFFEDSKLILFCY